MTVDHIVSDSISHQLLFKKNSPRYLLRSEEWGEKGGKQATEGGSSFSFRRHSNSRTRNDAVLYNSRVGVGVGRRSISGWCSE